MMWGSTISGAAASLGHHSQAQAQMDVVGYRTVVLAKHRHGENLIEVRKNGWRFVVVFWGKTRIPAIKRGR